eukprot:c30771_g1_i1 orf=134-298(+)
MEVGAGGVPHTVVGGEGGCQCMDYNNDAGNGDKRMTELTGSSVLNRKMSMMAYR